MNQKPKIKKKITSVFARSVRLLWGMGWYCIVYFNSESNDETLTSGEKPFPCRVRSRLYNFTGGKAFSTAIIDACIKR